MKTINICVCTYQREKSLAYCLDRLTKITIPDNTSLSISVIDNDPKRSAMQQVQDFSPPFSLPVYYFHEENRGIPYARNRAIIESLNLNADFLVFIDDDEWPEPDWLVNMYRYYQSHKRPVIISGHVISDLPENTPQDIQLLFNKKNRATGTHLTSCATNNVLIPLSIIKDSGVRFDENNPLAGGTDTIFFYTLSRLGYEIFKCSEARVHEIIPENRLSLKWMAKRKYRAGITAAWRKKQAGRLGILIVLSALLQICLGACKVIGFSLVGNKFKRNETWLTLYRSAGIISGCYGVQVSSYRNVDGQ